MPTFALRRRRRSGAGDARRSHDCAIASEIAYLAALTAASYAPEHGGLRLRPERADPAPRAHECTGARGGCHLVTNSRVQVWTREAAPPSETTAGGLGDAAPQEEYVHVCCRHPGCDDVDVHRGAHAAAWTRAPQHDLAAGSVAVCLTSGAWHICASAFLNDGEHPSMHGGTACAAVEVDVPTEGATVCAMTGRLLASRRIATMEDMEHWASGTIAQSFSTDCMASMVRSGGGAGGADASERRTLGGGGTVTRASGGGVHHNADIARKRERYAGKQRAAEAAAAAGAHRTSELLDLGAPTGGGGADTTRLSPYESRKKCHLIVRAPGVAIVNGSVPPPSATAACVTPGDETPSPGSSRLYPAAASLQRLAERNTAAAAAARRAGASSPSLSPDTSDPSTGASADAWPYLHRRRRGGGDASIAEALERAPMGGCGGETQLQHTVEVPRSTRRRARHGGGTSGSGGARGGAAARGGADRRTATFVRGNRDLITVHKLEISYTLSALMSEARTHCDLARIQEREAAALAAVHRATAVRGGGGGGASVRARPSVPQLICMFYKLACESGGGGGDSTPFVLPQDGHARAALLAYMHRLVLRVWHTITASARGRDAVLVPPIDGNFRACVLPILVLLAQGVAVTCPRVVADRGTHCPVEGGQVYVVQRDEIARRLCVTDRATLETLGLPANTHALVSALSDALTLPLYDADVARDAERWIALYERMRVDGGDLAQMADDTWMGGINLLPHKAAAAAAAASGTTPAPERTRVRARP